MPTKVKGMTSLEIAIIVVIVLAIAVAAAWYLYSTFAATIGSSPKLRVVSAYMFYNGTVKVDVMNTGSTTVGIIGADVFERRYPVRGNVVVVGPSASATVYIDTNRAARLGSIIQGKLITTDGYIIPFSVRRGI